MKKLFYSMLLLSTVTIVARRPVLKGVKTPINFPKPKTQQMKAPVTISSFAGVILDNTSKVALENSGSKVESLVVPPKSIGFLPAHIKSIPNGKNVWSVIYLQVVGEGLNAYEKGPVTMSIDNENLVLDFSGIKYTEKSFPKGDMKRFFKNKEPYGVVISIQGDSPSIRSLVRLTSSDVEELLKNGKIVSKAYQDLSTAKRNFFKKYNLNKKLLSKISNSRTVISVKMPKAVHTNPSYANGDGDYSGGSYSSGDRDGDHNDDAD